MNIFIETMEYRTAIDLTDRVLEAAPEFDEGLLLVTCPHTSAAVFFCEVDDELLADFVDFSNSWLVGLEPFRHIRNNNPNAAAHITSAVFGGQLLIPVRGGKPTLGTYQRVIFLELDGPKQRRVDVTGVAVSLQEAKA